MQLSHLALAPVLAACGFAVGHFTNDTIDIERLVSADGQAVFTVPANEVVLYEVPVDAWFVLTDIEVMPFEGPTTQVALIDKKTGRSPRLRLSSEFLTRARLFEQLGPRSDMAFEPGSRLVLTPHREFLGATCFAYHLRGRLVCR